MDKNSKIYVAGHNGMVGSAVMRCLQREGYTNIIVRSHSELDLCNQQETCEFFDREKPEYVFLVAARVGGIDANNEYKAEFLYENAMIELNVINAAYKNGCKKLLFVGTACVYPKNSIQPIKESELLKSELENTTEGYALAKIVGMKYCEFLHRQYGVEFISVTPTNIYGEGDNYHPSWSHVVPGMLRRFHEAKINENESVVCWGDGTALRDYLYVDDLASLCVFLMNNYSDSETVNAGTGKEISVKELAETISKVVGYNGRIEWDKSKPNGMRRKLLDVSKAEKLGWKSSVDLESGIRLAYKDFLKTLH